MSDPVFVNVLQAEDGALRIESSYNAAWIEKRTAPALGGRFRRLKDFAPGWEFPMEKRAEVLAVVAECYGAVDGGRDGLGGLGGLDWPDIAPCDSDDM